VRVDFRDVLAATANAYVRRVLLVDDDPDASELLAELLRRRGHMVVLAGNADAALAEATAEPPDVAVLDIGLPGRDGYELARALRAALAGRRIHLIALTGYDRERDRIASKDAGFDAHLAKPVDTATLLGMIEGARRAG